MNLQQIYTELYSNSIIDLKNTDRNNCDKGTCHSYISFYELIFSQYKNNSVNLLEIGIQGGISLLLWEYYFINAEKITGVDIDVSKIQKKVIDKSTETEKIIIHNEDATSSKFVDKITNNIDIIIDDGSHSVHDQLASFKLLYNYLSPTGIYIIEDIQSMQEAEYLKNEIPYSWIIDRRRIKDRYDDVLLICKKDEHQ